MPGDVAVSFEHVSKKFRKGELHDSLRDLVPALVRRLGRRGSAEDLATREFWALDDVSFEVTKGEAFGIIGRNGAGKSTILKILSGIMDPTLGRLSVEGRLSALIEIGAGFHPDLTGRENVYLNGIILGMRRREIDRKFDEIVAFSGIEEFIDTPVKRYSSGMHARLGFSVAAHLEPDVLVIDEVLSVGDALFRKKGVEKMHAIATSGATVVFVSHDLRAVSQLCDRCLLLERGKTAVLGPTGAAIQQYLSPSLDKTTLGERSGVSLTSLTVRGEDGPRLQFSSGERAWVAIEVLAHEDTEALSIGLAAYDEGQRRLFDASSQRMGHPPVDLGAGERARFTFEIDLNFASGTFHFGAWVYRYDVQQLFDEWVTAATIFVSAVRDVQGVVNLNPRVVIEQGLPGGGL